MRPTQRQLKLLIIDEISLVRSDLLYQLNFRLQKDIFQNNLPFGGLAVFVFGDIMQIRPPGARHVFLSPLNPRLQILHARLEQIWQSPDLPVVKRVSCLLTLHGRDTMLSSCSSSGGCVVVVESLEHVFEESRLQELLLTDRKKEKRYI